MGQPDIDGALVGGAALNSYMADVDTDAAFEKDTEVVADGYFHESEFRSAPYFDVQLDGIELLPWVGYQPLLLAYAIFGFATVAVVSAATYTALYQFFRMCSRLKQGTAFTRANEHAMRLIALCCFVGGAMLGAGTVFSLAVNIVLGWCELMLFFTLAYLGVALCAWALHLLLQRAVSMQEEADLTI